MLSWLSNQRRAAARHWRAIAVLVMLSVSDLGQAETNSADVITFELGGNPPLKIQRGAPGVSNAAWELATSIKTIDQQLQTSAAITNANDPELEAATRLVVAEFRDEAIRSLQLALDIQERTSGSLDATLMSSASANATEAMGVLRKPPVARFVLTNVSTSAANTFIQYMSAGALKLGTGTWSSYNPGARLPISIYMFRVCTLTGGTEIHRERVPILEPTTLMLNVAKQP